MMRVPEGLLPLVQVCVGSCMVLVHKIVYVLLPRCSCAWDQYVIRSYIFRRFAILLYTHIAACTMSVFAGAVKSEPADGNGSTSFGTVTEGSAAAVLSGGSGKIDTRDEYSRSYGALSRQYAKKILDRVEFYETLHRLVSVCESEYRQRMDKVPLERPVRLPDWWISRRHDDVRIR